MAARDPITLHALGIEAFRAGQLARATDLIAQAIDAGGQMPDFHYNLAIVLKARGKLQDAAASYQRAIALKPDYADAHNNLGNIWKELNEPDKARASFARALALRPGNADTHYNLGLLSRDAGDIDQAARHLQSCLESDPGDARGVRILLAHLGAETPPGRASPAQVQTIYDVRSRFWDQEEAYYGHVLVADALKQHLTQSRPDILDIGCGTGLLGALVRPLARRLDGVDLSAAMLEKARAKNLYDRLYQADVMTFLSEQAGGYDAILAAAVLIHFGDLKPLFQAAHASLRDQGLLLFTLFLSESDADFTVAANARLAQSGCFSHSPAYVERLAAQCGFSVKLLNQAVHEHDQDGKPVAGLVAVLQRP